MSRQIVAPPHFERLTPWEAGRALGYGSRYVSILCARGALPAARTLGGHRRIPRAAVVDAARKMGLAWALNETKEHPA